VVLTLVLQALPAAWLARRLGLLEGHSDDLAAEAEG
jgi:hypothetical protein